VVTFDEQVWSLSNERRHRTRIATARENAWLGDVEQLQLTLGHLYDKQDQVHRLLETLPAEALITAAPTLTT